MGGTEGEVAVGADEREEVGEVARSELAVRPVRFEVYRTGGGHLCRLVVGVR